MTIVKRKGNWTFGENGQMKWFQLIDEDQAKITFKRKNGIENIEIFVYQVAPKKEMCDELPCYAEFSFSVGEGEETIAVDGVGFLYEMTDGSIGFSTGRADFDVDLEVFHPVLLGMKDRFTIYVNDMPFQFYIDNKNPLMEMYGVNHE
jgi:hypothetical protein